MYTRTMVAIAMNPMIPRDFIKVFKSNAIQYAIT